MDVYSICTIFATSYVMIHLIHDSIHDSGIMIDLICDIGVMIRLPKYLKFRRKFYYQKNATFIFLFFIYSL